MRYEKKVQFGKLGPQHMETRVVTKFLVIPKCIKGEWRWLEVATYQQTYLVGTKHKWWKDDYWVYRK